MKKKLFKEEQRYRGLELMILIAGFMVAVLFRLYKEVITLGAENMGAILLCLGLLVTFGLGLKYILGLRIKTAVGKKNITFKMSPFHGQKQKIKLKDIESCAVVETPVAAQWHGSNISMGNENYYSLCGRNGLRIRTKDGETYFLGSRRLHELEQSVRKVMGE